MILFVNGFNRSGTTVLQEAVAAATGGSALTVADLARHGGPDLAAKLRRVLDSPDPIDRGVDRRRVREDTPEEYGWLLLNRITGRRLHRFHPRAAEGLRGVIDGITERAGVAVLKNPPDFGLERRLLRSFPEAGIIMVRRPLADITDSSCRAVGRLAASPTYVLALTGGSLFVRTVLGMQGVRGGAWLTKVTVRWRLRARLLFILRTTRGLPLDRVAFLDYEELAGDPDEGARWAGHLLESERLAKEFREAHSHPKSPAPPPAPLIDRWLDRRWLSTWQRMRAAQVRAGVIN